MKSGNRTNIVIVVHTVLEHITIAGIDYKSALFIILIDGASPMVVWRYCHTTYSEYSSVNIFDMLCNIFHSCKGR